MDFSKVAAVSGKGGLFKVISPTRSGVILETLDEQKKKIVTGMQHKVSVLSEITIYTTDSDGATPLEEVMQKIHKEFDGDTDLTGNSDPEELKSFLKFILPTYDESRVYVSDIKKLVNWYNQLATQAPEVFEKKNAEKKEETEKEGEKQKNN